MIEPVFSGFHQHFNHDGHQLFAHIFSAKGTLPNGFNIQTIPLDASEHSSLKWKIESDAPLIFWELDLALDPSIVEDEPRYLSLELAIDHFTQTVFPKYEERTFGVALYRGLFHASLLDPLKLLASHLPDTVRPFVLFDTQTIEDEKAYFRALNQHTLGFLIPILKGRWPEQYPYAFPALAWDHPHSPLGIYSDILYPPLPERRLSSAVLIPEEGDFPILEGPVRMIPEQLLTHEWEGVDQLIVDPSSVSERCRRKLLGFEAAGGQVEYLSFLEGKHSLR